ncbi:hypothetical protein BP6252_01462 [Coleophoma cylindrospora]|uniref:Uncharacterized protein n=1 Tax=Coleophoma cylindrospora TaxID=1849047 RepID=A0A3D8SSZ2_9HELO|nr:hypothetical protein BP6252_01462 [Coleophoma cylindrospora]
MSASVQNPAPTLTYQKSPPRWHKESGQGYGPGPGLGPGLEPGPSGFGCDPQRLRNSPWILLPSPPFCLPSPGLGPVVVRRYHQPADSGGVVGTGWLLSRTKVNLDNRQKVKCYHTGPSGPPYDGRPFASGRCWRRC